MRLLDPNPRPTFILIVSFPDKYKLNHYYFYHMDLALCHKKKPYIIFIYNQIHQLYFFNKMGV